MSEFNVGDTVDIAITGARIDGIDGDTLGVELTPGAPVVTPVDIALVDSVTVTAGGQQSAEVRQLTEDRDRAEAKLQAIKQLHTWKNEDGRFFVFADDLHEVMRGEV